MVETMSEGQAQTDQIAILNNLVSSIGQLLALGRPAIVADGLYTRTQLEDQLRVSNVTFSAWIEFNGLEGFQPGTKETYFVGRDVIEWMRQHKTGITKPRTPKEKAEARKNKT